MTDLQTIVTEPGLSFDVLASGPADAPLVLLLHGFAESFHTWREQIEALAAAGYRAVAPSQRGYCAGARPDPRDPSNYEFDKLADDAMEIAARCGAAGKRFHLVGHDWGGSIAWGIADKHPGRLASLTILSRPHPVAFNKALMAPDGEQARRSAHHRWFLEADAVPRLLADDSRWLRERLAANKVPPDAIARTSAISAMRLRWRRRWPGTAPAARYVGRSERSACPRSTSGAMPTTPSAAPPRKALSLTSRRRIGSRCCPAAGISCMSRCRSGSARSCWRISRPIRPSSTRTGNHRTPPAPA
jgi:pimeloyl-ACP methyl ester carboxylesterase